MAVIQEAFFIPDDIATGLATGLYRRLGGVVRYATGPNKGQIVKHLDPINLPSEEEAKGAVVRMVELVKDNKKILLVGSMILAAVGGGVYFYKKRNNRESAVLTRFRKALAQYIDAVRMGAMEAEKIDALMDALGDLEKDKNYDKVNIKLTAEDFGVLVNRIHEYTVRLAINNDFEIEMEKMEGESDLLHDLQSYLLIQKRIFEEAA